MDISLNPPVAARTIVQLVNQYHDRGGLNKVVLYILLLAGMFVQVSCAELEARNEAYAGKDALMACQFSDAVEHFERAYRVLSHHPDVTFGLAVALLLDTLAEDDVSSILYEMGFTQDITSFCSDMMERDTPKDEPGEDICVSGLGGQHASVVWPHPCWNSGECSIWEHLDQALSWMDIISVIQRHEARLSLVSELLASTADELDDAYTLENVFGYKKLTIHAADLYLFSGLMELARFVTDIVSHYALDFSVYDTFVGDSCWEHAQYLNHHLGFQREGVETEVDLHPFEQGMFRLKRAFEEAYGLREKIANRDPESCPPSFSILKWNDVPYGVLDNMRQFTASFVEEPYTVTDVLFPDIVIDVKALVRDLPFQNQGVPLMTCEEVGLTSDLGLYIRAINRVSTPDLLDESCHSVCLHPDVGYRLSSGWKTWSLEDLW